MNSPVVQPNFTSFLNVSVDFRKHYNLLTYSLQEHQADTSLSHCPPPPQREGQSLHVPYPKKLNFWTPSPTFSTLLLILT